MTSKFNYIKNSVVIVWAEGGDEYFPLWIAKIVDTRSKKGVVVTIKVHRYQPYSNSTWLTSKYAPTYRERRQSYFKKPWKDENFNRFCCGHILFSDNNKRTPSFSLKVLRGKNSLCSRRKAFVKKNMRHILRFWCKDKFLLWHKEDWLRRRKVSGHKQSEDEKWGRWDREVEKLNSSSPKERHLVLIRLCVDTTTV